MQGFREKNEALRKAGTGAQAFAATMIPAVVSISYINYAIVAILGGIMALQGMTDVGSLASYLVFVRQAAAPINQFTQQEIFCWPPWQARSGYSRPWPSSRKRTKRKVERVHVEADGAEEQWAWRREDGTLVPLRGDVRFREVYFGYDSGHPF